MCNGWNHQPGCECGFGPPYPGTIELVEKREWIDEAVDHEDSFKRALKDLNFDRPTFNSFVREYSSIQSLGEPRETLREKIKRLVGRLEYREESSELVSIKVPLFKLHSPSIRGARVIYRESMQDKERGWLVKVFGIGMGSTNTYRVVYDPPYISENGECLQVFVPLVLHAKSIGVYRSGVLQSRGIRAEIEGIEDERTLRQRGCDTLPKDECADKSLLGAYRTQKYALSQQRHSQRETFTSLLKGSIARTVELHIVNVLGYSIKPIADVKHQQQLELEFELPGSRDYSLCYNSSGLHWDIV